MLVIFKIPLGHNIHYQLAEDDPQPGRVLVVQAHPSPCSLSAAITQTVCAALKASGHEVRLVQLYGDENGNGAFNPVLSRSEWEGFYALTDSSKPDHRPSPEIANQIANLRWATALVLIFPTWWFGPPSILKGYIDRTFLPGVAYNLPSPHPSIRNPTDGEMAIPEPPSPDRPTITGLVPGLTNIKKLAVVTTYGAPWWIVRYVGDPGRRMIVGGLRPLFNPQCTAAWHCLYDMDNQSKQSCGDFLSSLHHTFTHF
eukprot:comp5109_c0_seq2/m.1186 comp5109_c0_seq2/g.1186  ORF comp5109_c0_seq2/g.1186 comp5109_c0_seq2/m.1186 type:complete len:256 (-) comp5109_c0_seq2:20-787(-)